MLKRIKTNSKSKTLRTILYHPLTKLFIIKFSQNTVTDSTVAPSAMALFLARQTPITKCKIIQMINDLTVQVGWTKSSSQKKPTEKSPFEVKPSTKTPTNPIKERKQHDKSHSKTY